MAEAPRNAKQMNLLFTANNLRHVELLVTNAMALLEEGADLKEVSLTNVALEAVEYIEEMLNILNTQRSNLASQFSITVD
jgi:hypothetical protein